MRKEHHFTGFPGIRGTAKANATAKEGLLRRITHIPIPYGDLKKQQ